MKVIAVLRKSNSLVYIRVTFGRDKDVKVSTSMHIDPIYWDSKIPGYKNTKKVPKEVREKFNNTLKEMIAYVEANVDKDVTCPVLTAIIDDFLHPDFFAKFGLYHSTMRPSSKNSSFSGGLRLKEFSTGV